MLKQIEGNFSLFIALGFVIGLLMPGVAKAMEPYILYFLVGIMFFTMLKIDPKDLRQTASNPSYILYLAAMILFISPIVQYSVAKVLYPGVAASVLIIGALPSAMSSTSITDLLKGNVHIALLLTVITSLLAPFTMPFLIELFIGVETQASFSDMVVMLAKVVFVPFVLSVAVKRAVPGLVGRTSKYYAMVNIFLLFLIIMAIIGSYSDYMLEDIDRTVRMALFFFLLAAMMHIIGWYSSFWRPFGDRVASSTIIYYCNISLGVVFTAKFFSPMVVLGVVLYNIPWSTMPVPFHYIVKRFEKI
ncbi:MAG TPA: bile acid:sodium symporter [Candidatus Methanofastidiosa archaeon]|nr:bile acid:sodium symporter [Candidatus Methanofastidiosa archaeon]